MKKRNMNDNLTPAPDLQEPDIYQGIESDGEGENFLPESLPEPEKAINDDTMERERRKKTAVGRIMMVIGALCFLGGAALWSMNIRREVNAERASCEMLPEIRREIVRNMQQQAAAPATEPQHVNPYDQEAVDASNEMTVVVKNGWPYIGYLSLPTLKMDLPILSEWSFFNLGMAPCRHMGSTKSDDLVLCAHNYPTHFGKINQLKTGDAVYFTDMDGVRSDYTVVTLNIIGSDDIDLVTDPALDLVMYTCTYSGEERVMVGCQRVKD